MGNRHVAKFSTICRPTWETKNEEEKNVSSYGQYSNSNKLDKPNNNAAHQNFFEHIKPWWKPPCRNVGKLVKTLAQHTNEHKTLQKPSQHCIEGSQSVALGPRPKLQISTREDIKQGRWCSNRPKIPTQIIINIVVQALRNESTSEVDNHFPSTSLCLKVPTYHWNAPNTLEEKQNVLLWQNLDG